MNLPISGKRCLFCYRNVQTCTSHGLSFSIQRGRPPSTGSGPFCSFCHFFFSCSASLSSLICLFLPPLGMNHFFFFPLPRDSCFPSLLLCLYFPSQCFLPEFPFCCCFNLSLTHITLSFSVFTTVWYFPELLWLSWGSSYHCIIQFLPCWKKKKNMLHVSLLFLSMKVITVWRNVIVMFLICFCFCSSVSISFILDIWSAIRFLLTACWKGIYQVTSVASCNTSL